MNTLIQLTNKKIGTETNSVNARELHSFIQSKSDYSNWITRRIKKYDFQENKDYIIIETKKAGNNATLKEYYITLNMAKELSMVENNEKGRQARRWFIEIAEKYQQTIQQPKNNPYIYNLERENVELKRAINRLTYNQEKQENCINTTKFSEIMNKVQTKLYNQADEAIVLAHKELTDMLYKNKPLLN